MFGLFKKSQLPQEEKEETWDDVKSFVYPILVSDAYIVERTKQLQEMNHDTSTDFDLVSMPYLDMQVLFVEHLEDHEKGMYAAQPIVRSTAKGWGLTEANQLWDAAFENLWTMVEDKEIQIEVRDSVGSVVMRATESSMRPEYINAFLVNPGFLFAAFTEYAPADAYLVIVASRTEIIGFPATDENRKLAQEYSGTLDPSDWRNVVSKSMYYLTEKGIDIVR